ncbi:helix-turn-helix domain-containing protein [Chitinophaga polysaccharea]|uniref:helix-turn-helix domain-containing protein n=1 Tax=Chitinophaga polysaccharea TaxID=1293035 RepID=UPI001159816E|nr:helix-turn-helix domain-containing protein [Chitinophaga polysaccharea]
MDTIFIPNEGDFKRWIKEALREITECQNGNIRSQESTETEPLLSRKEIAFMFKVSLVTLNNWKKAGLPSYKQGGRVYFLYSEVMAYLKQKTKPE